MNVLYSSKFDPITNAHINIIKRLKSLFDNIIIDIMDGNNINNFFTAEEQLYLIKQLYKNEKKIRVILGSNNDFDSLRLAKIQECDAVVRVLNRMSDYSYEEKINKIAKDMYNGNLNVIHLFIDDEFKLITSSTVKELFNLHMDISNYVPNEIQQAMKIKKKRIY